MQNVSSSLNRAYLYQDHSFFKGLNTLRFGAALLVLLQHGEGMKNKNGLPALTDISLFHNGANAVTFFFVLSGFLITFFLLKEKKRTQNIKVKRFYLKRVLRIFPLYFLLVLLGVVLVPLLIHSFGIAYDVPYTFGQTWYYYLFFLPCLVTFYYGHHLLEPLWSIGVEVLFYTIWAPLFKVFKKHILTLLLFVIGVRLAILSYSHFFSSSELFDFLAGMYSFEALAIGGLGAYFVFYSKRDISAYLIFRKPVQYFVVLIFIVFLLFNRDIENEVWRTVFGTPILSSLLFDFMALYLILAVSLAKNKLFNIESETTWYFGEISYGIYMYHTTIISITILLLKKNPFAMSPIFTNLLFFVLVIAGTLMVAHLSKKYFENYFLGLLKKKERRL